MQSNIKAYKPHEECGVFGLYSDGSLEPAYACYNGLMALQHRGQASCGIAVNDNGVISYSKDMGLVTEVFRDYNSLNRLKGRIAISHVRYATAEDNVRENSQPLVMRYIKGNLAIALNGNLTNGPSLRYELERTGSIFQTTIDSEIIAYIIAHERIHAPSIEEAIRRAMYRIRGVYSMLVMSPQKLIAVRDPHGIRPLCIGQLGGTYVFASETCALDACGAHFVRDVEPGEIVIVDKNGLHSIQTHFQVEKSLCIFEYIYFARTDSIVDGISVYEARKEAGRQLAKEYPVEADMVIGVPESGVDTAIGYSEESGIPFEKGIVKNTYVGRTFIQPTQGERERTVRIKLNTLSTSVKGKRIVMLDDSIVRGTTFARIVAMLKDEGAKEVHLRISSPPFMWPCYYGTDIPSRNELLAYRHTAQEIAEILNVESLGFLSLNGLREMVKSGKGGYGYCDACFTGNYPAGIPEEGPDVKDYRKPIRII